MRKIIFAIAVCFAAISLGFADSSGNYRAGNKVLSAGDPISRVLDAMGPPESKEPVQNYMGAQTGEYWYYTVDNKTVKFYISGGRVIDIEEIR